MKLKNIEPPFFNDEIFYENSIVTNVCEINELNKQRYIDLIEIRKEFSKYIDNENSCVLTDQYIEKFKVYPEYDLSKKLFTIEDIEQILKTISTFNNAISNYPTPYYMKDYVKQSFSQTDISDFMISNRKIGYNNGIFQFGFFKDKINNLQLVQLYPEELLFISIFISQKFYHDYNFFNDLLLIWRKYNFKEELLDVFLNDWDEMLNEYIKDANKIIWSKKIDNLKRSVMITKVREQKNILTRL